MTPDISDPQYSDKILMVNILSGVMDPELGINIIDLGLIYNIEINKPGNEITITMTLSTPSCPAGSFIKNNVEAVVKELFPAYTAIINLTFEPLWSFDNISEAGRTALGW